MVLSSSTQFETLVLSAEEYRNALVEEDELLKDGKRYDIKQVRKSGQFIYVTLIRDTQEESVLKLLTNLIRQGKRSDKPAPDFANELASLSYMKSASPLPAYTIPVSDCVFLSFSEALTEQYIGFTAPPPKVA